MGCHRSYIGTLTEEERKYLEVTANSRISEHRRVIRAKAILLSADGYAVKDIARKVGLNRKAVTLLCKRWMAFGAKAALSDLQRPGRPPLISAAARTWVTELACSCPKDLDEGPARQVWSLSSLMGYVKKHCMEKGYPDLATCSTSTIWHILNDNTLKPHRMGYYLERKDPEFDEKAEKVLLLYKRAVWMLQMAANPEYNKDGLTPSELTGEVILSYDEKPGIQAIGTIALDLLPTTLPDQGYTRRDYEYKRHGTLSLLAGIDLMSGEVTAIVRDSHSATEFIEFLELADSKYPKELVIKIILDNHSVHRSRKVMEWLNKRPGRFVFTFTPKHASWLNLIEGFFGKLARTGLKHLRVKSKGELRKFLENWIAEVNQHPVVFHWKWGLEDIQGALKERHHAA